MKGSIFERYGGFAQVSKMVMDFYDRVLDSDVIGDYFVGVDMPRLIDHQTKFMSGVMGGPVTFTDATLKRAHEHLQIDQTAFDEMCRLLGDTLENFDMDRADIDDVLDRIKARSPHIINC